MCDQIILLNWQGADCDPSYTVSLVLSIMNLQWVYLFSGANFTQRHQPSATFVPPPLIARSR